MRPFRPGWLAKADVKKPVLVVGNFLSATIGNRSVCEELAARLARRGWPVFTTSHEPGRLLRLFDMVSAVWRRRDEYALAQVDVYSGPAFLWAEAACWTLRLLGKPYVLTLHGGNLPIFAKRWPRRVRSLLHSAVIVTTPSHYLLERMMSYRADLRLQPNPLDLGCCTFRLRQQPQPRLVWLRAFHRTYNPTLAPKVVALLSQDFPNVHLTMVGPDKQDGSLRNVQRAAIDLGIAHRISLPGRVPKAAVPDWLNKGDIFLNTTNVDNAPISILEAMACGLCVVSTNVGGIPYLLDHEQDALLVRPEDPQGMAAAVRRLLTEPGLAECLSRKGRQKAEQFDWSVILPQWESLIMAAMMGRDHVRPAG